MEEKSFIRAAEIASELDISTASAYKLIRILNKELEQNGFYTVRGRVSRQYYKERVYGISKKGVS